MRNNASAMVGSVVRGTAATIATENAILDCAGTTVTASGNKLTIVWRMQAKTPMKGKNCNLYMSAADMSGTACAWTDKGDVSVK
jgi:hypothetical protein